MSDEERLRWLLGLAIDRFHTIDDRAWRVQQFYTTLNTSIIGIAAAILRLGGPGDKSVTVLLFMIGAAASAIGFLSVRKLRRYWLSAEFSVAKFERLLEHHLPLKHKELEWATLGLDITEGMHDKQSIFTSKDGRDQWIKSRTWVRGGIQYYFALLQLVFLVINVIGSIGVFMNWL